MRQLRMVGIGLLSIVWASLLITGCGSAPNEEMKEADRLLRAAKESWAEKYAPEEFALAQKTFEDAKAKVEAKDYEGAREAALKAAEQAETAKSAARRNTARMERDAETGLNKRAKIAFAETKDLFEQLQAKITGEPLKALQATMASVETSIGAAEKNFDEGEFTECKETCEDIVEKSVQLRSDIWDAAEAAVLKADPNDSKEVAVIETKFGKIAFEFAPTVAPNHVKNFKKLAKTGFYDGTTFHRVIPGFMIQGGDPNTRDDDRRNDGTGSPGYLIDAEFNNRKHERGVVSMARGGDPNSAGSQFFICVAKQPSLDDKYTIFGQVLKGMEVADQIVKQQRDGRDNPLDRIEMKVSIVDRSKI